MMSSLSRLRPLLVSARRVPLQAAVASYPRRALSVRARLQLRAFSSTPHHDQSDSSSSNRSGKHNDPPCDVKTGGVDPRESGVIPEYSGPSLEENRARAVEREELDQIKEDSRVLSDELGGGLLNDEFEQRKQVKNQEKEWEGFAKKFEQPLHKRDKDRLTINQRNEEVGDWRRPFTTRAARAAPESHDYSGKDKGTKERLEDIKEDLKENVKADVRKARSTARKASQVAEDVGQDLKESAGQAWRLAKEEASQLKGAVEGKIKKAAKKIKNAVPEALHNAKEKVEEDLESLKRAAKDGPQDMPQGVGKRATDPEGNPMETGAPRT